MYSIVDDANDPISTIKWEYKYTSGSCTPPWYVDPQTGETATFYEHRPGTWEMRLTVTYGQNSGGAPPHDPTVITKTVTIASATGVTIAGGLNSPVNNGDPITLEFQVNGANGPCGPYIAACLAQEKIINKWLRSPPLYPQNPPDDTDWTPSQAAAAFQFNQSVIEDVKNQNFSAEVWDNIPTGTYYEADQQLRIKYTDPCGDVQYISLGTVHIKRVKLANGQWQLEQ